MGGHETPCLVHWATRGDANLAAAFLHFCPLFFLARDKIEPSLISQPSPTPGSASFLLFSPLFHFLCGFRPFFAGLGLFFTSDIWLCHALCGKPPSSFYTRSTPIHKAFVLQIGARGGISLGGGPNCTRFRIYTAMKFTLLVGKGPCLVCCYPRVWSDRGWEGTGEKACHLLVF